MKTRTHLFVLLLFSLLLYSCAYNSILFRSNYQHVNQLIHNNAKEKPYLKAHMRNGDIYIMRDFWDVDTVRNVVTGDGIRYDYNRKKIDDNKFVIPIDSVAIFETNNSLKRTEDGRIATLAVLTSVDAIMSLICLTNPKACFGSCPTFYTGKNEDIHYANAEGFSSSISPSLESADIDALDTTVRQPDFTITMKNEALETHCVKDVKLLACPHNSGERVYQTNHDVFYSSDKIYPLQRAHASEGDITTLLAKNDKQEWVSLSDKNDLCAREEVILEYPAVNTNEPLALEMNFRQSFLSTYLFYSIMGYMGNEVGFFFAKMETDDKVRNLVGQLHEKLGGIDVYVWNEQNGVWDFQDSFNELGPVAFNNQIMPLKAEIKGTTPVKIKLCMSKGSWKVDYAALVNLKNEVKPVTISAGQVMNKGKEDRTVITSLNDPKKHLVTMPGDVYKLTFALPSETVDYDLFLYTKGYYLEWMRDHWIKDKNLLALKRLYDHPEKYLKREAPQYKRYESDMNDLFWGSRVNTINE